MIKKLKELLKMKNKLSDLNNHLFEQLERLNDIDLKGEELGEEIIRAKAISNIANTIINSGTLALEAQKVKNNSMSAEFNIPKMLE